MQQGMDDFCQRQTKAEGGSHDGHHEIKFNRV
jgi:hypothetical protein